MVDTCHLPRRIVPSHSMVKLHIAAPVLGRVLVRTLSRCRHRLGQHVAWHRNNHHLRVKGHLLLEVAKRELPVVVRILHVPPDRPGVNDDRVAVGRAAEAVAHERANEGAHAGRRTSHAHRSHLHSFGHRSQISKFDFAQDGHVLSCPLAERNVFREVLGRQHLHLHPWLVPRRVRTVPRHVHDCRVGRLAPRLDDAAALHHLVVGVVVVRGHQQRESQLEPRHVAVLRHHLVCHRDHHVAFFFGDQNLLEPLRSRDDGLRTIKPPPEGPRPVQVLVHRQQAQQPHLAPVPARRRRHLHRLVLGQVHAEPAHVGVDPLALELGDALAQVVDGHVRLVVAEAHVLDAQVVEHVHHALAVVQAGQQRRGEEVAREHGDGVGTHVGLDEAIEEGQIFQLVHIVDHDDAQRHSVRPGPKRIQLLGKVHEIRELLPIHLPVVVGVHQAHEVVHHALGHIP
mmetsp:Transcript_76641/g.206483  ORF Transcript_76641/g.206483 Transcript_76641/m.206483 type:complete len:455 (+) Transcript_76641:525-1889(+)